MGTLKLYGYLRGKNLDVNSLVYLPTMGTFQMSEIHTLKRTNNRSEEVYELAGQADPLKQESLDSEAKYDEMNAEQTWPTEQELIEGFWNTVLCLMKIKALKKLILKNSWVEACKKESSKRYVWLSSSLDSRLGGRGSYHSIFIDLS